MSLLTFKDFMRADMIQQFFDKSSVVVVVIRQIYTLQCSDCSHLSKVLENRCVSYWEMSGTQTVLR